MTRSTPARRRGLRVREVLTVQLLPELLRAAALPRLRTGDHLEAAPAIYAGVQLPDDEGPDRWHVDEFGCMRARGTLLAAPLTHDDECGCRVDVLDTAGRLLPLNWAGTTPTEGRLHVEGALYLDAELVPGTTHGDAVALCRRPYQVAALRRYRRVPGRPDLPVGIRRVPAPSEVRDEHVYVADLVAPDRDPP